MGRVEKIHEGRSLHVDITYLHPVLSAQEKDQFTWPKRRDIECKVPSCFVFFGPVTLIGHDPFTLAEIADIKQTFATAK